MKNLEQKEGFSNRHTDGLPNKITTMRVVQKDADGEHIHLCEWHPIDRNQYSRNTMPSEGYLGCAIVIEGKYKGIGFNAWQQNNSEFVWYNIININN